MTKKDYRLIAEAIKSHAVNLGFNNRPWLEVFARSMADKLFLDNPRFNRVTFLKACGFEA